jgi:hypothetical protein
MFLLQIQALKRAFCRCWLTSIWGVLLYPNLLLGHCLLRTPCTRWVYPNFPQNPKVTTEGSSLRALSLGSRDMDWGLVVLLGLGVLCVKFMRRQN